jgi:hypothetical protein
MKLATENPGVNAGKAAGPAPKAAIKRPRSPKTDIVEVVIPRGDLATFTVFADHFGLTPEMVMVSAINGQLAALGDDTLSNLAYGDAMPAMVDPVTVRLALVPDLKALVELVAKLLCRSADWLMTFLLHEEICTLSSEIEDAIKAGGIETCELLEDRAKILISEEFEFRRGRMPKCGVHKIDSWGWLNLQRFRPSAIPKLAMEKGGTKQ